MSRAGAVALALVAATASARAEPAAPTTSAAPTLGAAPEPAAAVVLRLDATAGVDPGLIERFQREVEDRARRAGLAVTTGAANRIDAAALAGCDDAGGAGCDALILDTLSADELIYGAVDRSMSGHRLTVVRVRRGAAPVQTVIDVPAGDLDAAARAMGPGLDRLFAPPASTAADATSAPVAGAERRGGGIEARTAILIGGAAVAGALIVFGALQWGEASSLQGEIDDAPDATADDLVELLELEDRAAGYASRGNWLVLGGAAVGIGTAAYGWLTRDREPRAQAWLAPGATGGGVTLTWSTP